ncbi:Glutamate decarboxylase 1 [Liparis tanakae]|uniref:Glutamate decarboxylase 1 n=1 Tax=Liparis tanakae TaxID=230148 RepID=A0A4Z2GNK6_9TELE|nr:Glutamate decarboxylase 1 [Liparis tanakae]
MAASAPSSSGGEPDPNSTNLRPPGSSYDAWCGVAHGCTRKLGMKICGKLPIYFKLNSERYMNCQKEIREYNTVFSSDCSSSWPCFTQSDSMEMHSPTRFRKASK